MIGTDSESNDGVAPVCPHPDIHMRGGGRSDDLDVFDECCVGPHLRVPASTNYSNSLMAARLAQALTRLGLDDLEICD